MSRSNDIGDSVRRAIDRYFRDLDGEKPAAIYDMVVSSVERSMLETVMRHANGNQTTRWGVAVGTRTISWSSYDLPLTLSTQDGVSSQFAYGPNRSRWKQVAVYSASTTETTLYLGGVMEKVTRGAVKFR